jgi:hypothetical protein
MLILTETDGSFPDDTNGEIRYRLPTGLEPGLANGHDPQVVLSRGQGSGLLHLRLAPVWPELKSGDRRALFSTGRFRLVMRTPALTEVGQWWPTPLGQDVVVDRSVSLNAAEAAIARRLGEAGGEVVDVEVELTLRGIAPTFPWLVQCEGEPLRRTVAALLGGSPATWDQVESAFLGIGREMFQWHPLRPSAMPPAIDGALRAIAHHARPFLLESSASGWLVRPAAPERLALSLAVPYLDSRAVGMRWRFSEFLKAQSDPSRFLLDLIVPAPLQGASLLITNDVPLAADGIQRIEVEVKTGGPSGRVSHIFTPGQPSFSRVPFIRETFEDLDLEWRAILTIQTARGPAVVEAPGRKTGLNIDLTTNKIGLAVLRFRATPEVLAHTVSVEVTAGARTLALTSQKPEGWVVGRTPPAMCQVSAITSGGSKIFLGEYPVDGGLTVDATMLGIGEVSSIVFRPESDLAARAAYLAVQVESGPWRSLDVGAELIWPVQRASRLEPPRLRYRTRHVPRLATGTTGPLAESGWRIAESATVEVGV